MPKPTRRERRQLAEKGKLVPRRPAVRSTTSAASATVARSADSVVKTLPSEDAGATAQEYAYVKADLVRILVLAAMLISIMIALRIMLPQ
jgi:hypothetical protein